MPIPNKIQGAIFDVDDTLLDNETETIYFGLHERSRLAAVHKVGELRGISKLCALTVKENYDAFRDAKVHTLDSAIWTILYNAGLVNGDDVDPENEILQEIATYKNEFHEVILRAEGREVEGATKFVANLHNSGLHAKLAVASTAMRHEIEIFFEMTGLSKLIPDERIISRESITHAKPHPQAYDLAFATLGLHDNARSNVLAFEDDPRGIMSAKAAGLYVCAITTRYDRQKLASLTVPPDLIADSFAEFEDVLSLSVVD